MEKAKSCIILFLLFLLIIGCSNEMSGEHPDIDSPDVDDDQKPLEYLDTSLIGEDEDIIDFLFRQGYMLTWSDEFNSDSLDLEVWEYERGDGGWGNQELQYYSKNPEDVNVSDGNLNIIANYRDGRWFSGRLTTQHQMSFKYGYIEANVKLPSGKGMWPAFWLLGCDPQNNNSINWPYTGEFDIMEYSPSTQGENRVYSTLHTSSNHGGSGYDLGDKTYENDISEDYHRFGMLWTEYFIEVYYDGKLIGRKECPTNYNVDNWPFNHYNAFVILNLAIGGVLGGDGHQNYARYEYLIDYVRLYQRQGEEIILL